MKILIILSILSINIFAKDPIIIGSKSFSESIIISEMVAQILENKFGETVIKKHGLGGTKVALDALIQDAIHIYPDYTGTGFGMILGHFPSSDRDYVFDTVRKEYTEKWDITWSDSLGFDNTYALTVRKSDDRFKDIKNISELSSKVEKFVYASAYEFMERNDGHGQMVKTYDLNFSPDNIISMNAGLMYTAIRDKKVDMIVAYSTDGRINAYNLRKLIDDKKNFSPYQAALLAKNDSLKKWPTIQKTFHLLEDLISEEDMIGLNDKVDRQKMEPALVAKNYLISKQILSGTINNSKSQKGLISYFISKRKYLVKILIEHIQLTFIALFLAMLVSIPLGILLTRYENLAKFVFPIVNTIQTIPSLALLGFLIPIMGIGFYPATLALFLYSLLPLIRNTYSGILGVNKNYIEASRAIGLTNFQILLNVELPLAMPIILSGVRVALVIVIGTTTLAALIGAGGLGDPIFRGVSTVNSNLILLGAIPAAILAIASDKIIGLSERFLVSKGLRQK